MTQTQNNHAAPPPRPVRFHPLLPLRLDTWVRGRESTTQELVTATEAAIQSRGLEAKTHSTIPHADGIEISVYALRVWHDSGVDVFYTIENDCILVRGYGWETDSGKFDDFNGGGFFCDSLHPKSPETNIYQSSSEQIKRPAIKRIARRTNAKPSPVRDPVRHKAGPYSYGRDEEAFYGCWLIYAAAEEGPIASLPIWDSENGSESKEVEATAKLLAAAPQMLATLKLMDVEMAACTARYGDTELYWLVRAAITLAGDTPAPEFGVADSSQMLDKTSVESHRIPRRVENAINQIYEYLWREEKEDCFARPKKGRNGHIWWALVTLKAWRRRLPRKILHNRTGR